MKINGVFLGLFAASLQAATSFVVPSSRAKRSAFVLRPMESVVSTAASDVTASIPTEISVPTPGVSHVFLADIGLGGDLPLIPIAIAAVAILTVLSTSGKSTTIPTEAVLPPAPSSIGSSDLSIPYDAAARLAYIKSDKSMAYDAFKAKYEADAVADVKAKQKKPAGGKAVSAPAPSTIDSSDVSIPYDAAARLAYDKSDKSMAYDAFKVKYEADAVAEVKAKQKK